MTDKLIVLTANLIINQSKRIIIFLFKKKNEIENNL